MVQEVELKVKEVIQRTYNVKSVRLEITGKPDYIAGQFLCVRFKDDLNLKRYLSLSSSPTESGYIEFTKKITQSGFSCRLNNLKLGDTLMVKYPLGKFTLEGLSGKIAFLSGGIGITPIRSIIKYAIDTQCGLDMILVYSNRSVRDIVFKEDFDQMQKKCSKLKVSHVLCEAEPDFKCTVGLINAQIVKNEVPDYLMRKFFLCGPPLMVEAMKKILLEELAVLEVNIITENFVGY